MLRFGGQGVQYLVDQVPMAKSRAVAVAGADLFPGMGEGSAGGMDAARVQLRGVAQHRPPGGLAHPLRFVDQVFEHFFSRFHV